MWSWLAACVPFPAPAALPREPDVVPPPPAFRLVVAGDAGLEPEEAHGGQTGLLPALPAAMSAAAAAVPGAEVVWLGDNVYERGVDAGAAGAAAALRILAPQIAAGPTPAQVSFVAGNHDYLQFAAFRGRLAREAALVEAAGAHARAYAAPVERAPIPGTPYVRLYVDSERGIEDSAGARAAVLTAVTREVTAGNVPIVLGHHPAADVGGHGRPSPAAAFQTELAHPQYRTYAADLVAAARGRPALFVAGHEHAVELLDLGVPGEAQVVAGSAAKGRLGPPSADARIDRRPGFVTVDVYAAPPRAALTAWFLAETPAGSAGAAAGAAGAAGAERCAPAPTPGWSLCTAGPAWVAAAGVRPFR